MNAKKEEMLRRLDALAYATWNVTQAEYDYASGGEYVLEPFSGRYWQDSDGDVSVIYDRDGKVSRRVVR